LVDRAAGKIRELRLRTALAANAGTDPVGVFPHDAVRGLSVAAYSEKRSALLAMYDELFESLAGQSTLSPEWNARFSAALRMLVEPSLEPYYRALGEKFFERFLPEPAAT